MNINSLVMDQYRSGCCNIDINKKQKTNVLETFLKFLNDGLILDKRYFFTDKVKGNLDNLTFSIKQRLLDHLEYCHEKINHQHTNDYMKIYKELFDKTNDLFKSLNLNKTEDEIIDATNQFLFLIAHRDGKTHKGYTRTVNIYKNFLEKVSINIALKKWIKQNIRNLGKIQLSCNSKSISLKSEIVNKYIEAKDRILNCIDNQEPILDLSNLQLTLPPPPSILEKLNHIKYLKLNNNQFIKLNRHNLNKLVNLIEIDLSHNQIQEIEKYSFKKLNNLKSINLSYNKLKSFNYKLVSNLNNIRIIILNHNKDLKDINEKSFKNRINPIKLSWKNSQLTGIQLNTVNGLINTNINNLNKLNPSLHKN